MDTVLLWLDLLKGMAGVLGLLATLLVQEVEAGHTLPTVTAHSSKIQRDWLRADRLSTILSFHHMRFCLNFLFFLFFRAMKTGFAIKQTMP